MTKHIFLAACILLGSFTVLSAQTQDKVDFIQGRISLEITPKEKKILGMVNYTFDVLSAVDSIFLDAKNMEFSEVLLDDKRVKYRNNGQHLIIQQQFKKGAYHRLSLSYTAKPRQTVYFVGWNDTLMTERSRTQTDQIQIASLSSTRQVWTQGQGKYTSHWLPSFDDMTEKVEFDLNITFDENYQVIANGKLVATENQEPNTLMWSFDMEQPMSSYLLAFAIGRYDKKTIYSKRGIPIELYYYPQDSVRVEPTYRHTKKIFDFLEQEIGVPYPWQNYKQIPVKDFLYAGMENTTATIFSDDFMIDSTAFIDKNYVNVNAHELAHQWFGNLVTAVDGNHHWLQEGFATYYALLAEKEIFGEDYFYWKLFNTAKQLQTLSESKEGEALTDPKASSLTFYEKGAWALVMLEKHMGREAFQKGIVTYLKRYQFKNVTISGFLAEMERVTGKDVNKFESSWLQSTIFPMQEVAQFLKDNNRSISDYFQLQKAIETASNEEEKLALLEKVLLDSSTPALKKQLILDYVHLFTVDFFKELFLSKDLQVRQTLVLVVDKIPTELKTAYESLLTDASYRTMESILYKLWGTFPEDRKKYLDAMENVQGLPNKNVRLLWLTLAIATPDYNSRQTKIYFDELTGYTHPQYNLETRQTAFDYLFQTLGLTNQNLKDLANATVHHSWQFKKFARTLMEELLKDADYKSRIITLLPTLNPEEQRYINSKL